MDLSLDNTQEIPVTAAPDHPLDSPLQFEVLNGDATVRQGADPLEVVIVSGDSTVDPSDPTSPSGISHIRLFADRRRGPDVENLEEIVTLVVTAPPEPEASTLGLSVGSVRPKS